MNFCLVKVMQRNFESTLQGTPLTVYLRTHMHQCERIV